MPSVSVPVFDHARVDAGLQAARAGEREALLAYRQRVPLATEEVESALAQVRQGQLRLASLQEQARQAVRAEQPARKRFEAGGHRPARTAGCAAFCAARRDWTVFGPDRSAAAVVGLQRALGSRLLPDGRAAVVGPAQWEG
ncbi:TolC family protein [Aquincola sp. J276]|uniref:TolC family protein n=1 Tax=Aquincola sp. J276 TaxID=2898432 RepID=UPI002150B1D0|nr:TolC family protein [Aquincola sp. J276]MCR5864611.1 TolC family protein [Aquincola sp. J276]